MLQNCNVMIYITYFSLTLAIITMVGSCVAYKCTNRQNKFSGISFHSFPHNDKELLQKWVHNIRRKDWFPKRHSLICSEHFKQSCFVGRPGKKGRRLNPNAVPTIFQFPEHLQKKYIKRKSSKKHTIEDDTDNIDHSSPSKMAKIVESDHSYHKNHQRSIPLKMILTILITHHLLKWQK